MTIQEAAAELRARKISSVDLTKEAFRRMDALNPTLNAIQTTMRDSAFESARQADLELARGVLPLSPASGCASRPARRFARSRWVGLATAA